MSKNRKPTKAECEAMAVYANESPAYNGKTQLWTTPNSSSGIFERMRRTRGAFRGVKRDGR